MQVTFDSDDPLDAVLEVVKAIYGVELVVNRESGRVRHD